MNHFCSRAVKCAQYSMADMETSGFDLRGFIENSLLEWENHLAAVVIAGGCNLRCPYCHSWRYVTGLADLARLDPETVFTLLERQRGWLDGVVFTGGEPTLQPGLAKMIRRTREYGVKVKLHTNGSRPEAVEALLDERLLDCLALDYKAPLDERMFPVAGVAEDAALRDNVRKTFALAAQSGIGREYHTTLSPRFVDMATFADMADALEPGGLWLLQQYESGDCLDPVRAGGARYDEKQLEVFAALAESRQHTVVLKKGTLQA